MSASEDEKPVAILSREDCVRLQDIWDRCISALNLAIKSKSESEYRTVHDNLIRESSALWIELGNKYGFSGSGIYFNSQTGAIYRKPFLKGVHE